MSGAERRVEQGGPTVRARWAGGYRVDLAVRDGRFTLRADEPRDSGGSDTGPMPSELLFASLAACFTMAVAYVAGKRRLALPDLEVWVSGVADRPNLRYQHVAITAWSSLAETAPDDFATLLRLAKEVCWVTRTVEPGVTVTVDARGPERSGEER